MSLIARQTLKSTTYSFFGVILGFSITLYLMPHLLSTAEIGTIRIIQNYGRIFSNVFLLGLPATIIRVFPLVKNTENGHSGILFSSLLLAGLSSTIFAVIFFLSGSWFFEDEINNSIVFKNFYHWILLFSIAGIFFNLLDAYSTALKESTIGVFLKDVWIRSGVLILLFALYLKVLKYSEFVALYTFLELTIVFGLIAFLYYKKSLLLSSKPLFIEIIKKKEFFRLSIYNWISNASQMVVISVDTLMLGKMMGDSAVGVYSTFFYVAVLMQIPSRSLLKIGGPVLAEAHHEKNIERIKDIYIKSANNQFIVGSFIYTNLVIGLPVLLFLLPEEFKIGVWLIPIIGLGTLFKLATGIKSKIISTSSFYEWNSRLVLFFILCLVVSNYFGIKNFGLNGAAIATVVSTVLYNIASIAVVKWKIGILPIDKTVLKSGVIISLLSIPPMLLTYHFFQETYAILISTSYSLVFMFTALKAKLSDDIIALLSKIPILNKFV